VTSSRISVYQEPGLTKIDERHEEYLGLPAGFLYAGATTVVSSLWKVSDIATWFLMEVFAREVASGADVAKALRRAQWNLRLVSADRVREKIGFLIEAESSGPRKQRMVDTSNEILELGEYPFNGPYWWAGFAVNGI
jgi:CHAT domain-containing protein